MKKFNFLMAGMMLIIAFSCKAPEDFTNKYDDIVPDPVSNISVENVNGGAIIYFTLPVQDDMLGAKVVYSLTHGGEEMEKFSSTESNSIELEGFGDTDERTVTIYAVHMSDNVSVGYEVVIKPLTPPIQIIRESLEASSTWGGIKITWENPLRKQMGIAVMVEDSITGEMVVYDRYYSTAISGKVSFRPFKIKEQKFRIEMFDRWNNQAEPYNTDILPWAEEEIYGCNYWVMGEEVQPTVTYWSLFDDEKVGYGENADMWRWAFRGDISHRETNSGRSFNTPNPWGVWWQRNYTGTNMWNPGGDGNQFSLYVPGALPGFIVESPVYITFDMGVKAVYSRMKYLTRRRNQDWSANMPVVFSVWATNNPKTVEEVECPWGRYEKGSREANQAYWTNWSIVRGTDAWKNDWVKIADCRNELSSGVNMWFDGLTLSGEDYDKYNGLGWDFDFPDDVTEAFRYLRWEIHQINRAPQSLMMCGLKYWGKYEDKEDNPRKD